MLNKFISSFIPLFVAIDVLAVIPIFLTFTEKLELPERQRLVTASTVTAFGISVVFLLAGRLIFTFLGITENDFRIGGGILLLAISIKDLLGARHRKEQVFDEHVGIVPLGIPLTIGPAALTTILISVDAYGYRMTTVSLLLNLFIVWLAFRNAGFLQKVMGKSGAMAFARVMSIFLAAIDVIMIRVGITKSF